MIKFASTKINGNAKKGDKKEMEYEKYPIKSFSFYDIWAGISIPQKKEKQSSPPKQEKITRCVVISAYTDLDWISKALEYIETHRNKKGVEICFYLDYFASKFSILLDVKKRMKELNEKIREIDRDGGIFLVKKGQLFHSKIIITQTEKRCKIIVGSANFTENAFEGNEEIVLVDELDDMSNYPHYTWQIELYIEKMRKIAENVSDIKSPTEYKSLRSRLMDGKLYWKSNEYSPFTFNLGLPPKILKKISKNELKDENSALKKYLDNSFKNSLQLKNLMAKSSEIEEESNSEIDIKWKSYAVESAYGFWVPREYLGCVQRQLNQMSMRKRKILDTFCSRIGEQNEKIQSEFSNFLTVLKNVMGNTKEENDCVLKIENHWKQWYKKTIERLGVEVAKNSSTISKNIDENNKNKSESYRNKICQPYLDESVPDIWNDELSRQEFEESLISTIRYYSQCKERRLWIIKQILNVKDMNVNEDESILKALQNCKYELPPKRKKTRQNNF